MNKRQIEVQQAMLGAEKDVISRLKEIYTQASEECEARIMALSMRKDMENLQSIIWQKQYQEALKKQIDSVLDQLNTKSFTTIAEYLTECYENGFWGTMYDLQGQGIPLCFPMDQDAVVRAVRTDTKLSKGLYQRLGEDIDGLKGTIRSELSRGIANGSSWGQIAAVIAGSMNSPMEKAYRNSIRIARTEGHRIQNESAYDCQVEARNRGADIFKQWDSTLDSLTRPHHVELDGQVRAVEEPFEVAGMKAMYPGGFGIAGEDCNCRCCLLSKSRWRLSDEEYYTKWDGNKNELVRIRSKSYDEFKRDAQAVNSSLEYRIVNYAAGEYAVKERVAILEAVAELPQKVKNYIENTTIMVGSNGSYYHPKTDTIFIGKNAGKKEVLHEIGHAIEGMFDREKVDFVKGLCVKGLTARDIVMVTGRDSVGNETEIFVLQSEKLLDTYQGRLYINDPVDAILDDGTIDIGCMKEFVSVAVQQYLENPERVKKKNYDIFALMKEILK